jgi:interferon-induced transmembrane protein
MSYGNSPADGDGGTGQPDQYQGYGRYPGDGQYQGYGQPAVRRPPTYLAPGIVGLLFLWPAAIVSIVYASQVTRKWRVGDVAGAAIASKRARTWAIVSYVGGVLGLILLVWARRHTG